MLEAETRVLISLINWSNSKRFLKSCPPKPSIIRGYAKIFFP